MISHPNIEDEVTYMVDDSTSLISRDFIPEELQCDHKSERFIYCGTTGSGKYISVIISSLVCVWDKCETYAGNGVAESNEIIY